MRLHSERPGALNWLLLPGGPGIGSESLEELAACIDVPGLIWLVDLPGDGSNRLPPGAPTNPYSVWPGVLIEAAQAVSNPVFVGHSTGGMYLLATPALAPLLRGMVLLDTAPDASWYRDYVAMTVSHPIAEVSAAMRIYENDPSDKNIAPLAIASAPWNFEQAGLNAGRSLLERMPYNNAAVEWSDVNFDRSYRCAWWPRDIPVLVLAGEKDRIVSQAGWKSEEFQTCNAIFRVVPHAGHFPWIENPSAVQQAFTEVSTALVAS